MLIFSKFGINFAILRSQIDRMRLWIEKWEMYVCFVVEKVKTEETVAFESESETESTRDESQVLQSPGSACSQTHTTTNTKSDN